MFDVSVHIRCKTCYAVLIFEILTFIFMDKTKSCFIVQASGEAAFQVLDTLKQLDYPEQHV